MNTRRTNWLAAITLLCLRVTAAESQTKPLEYFSPAWSHDGRTIVFEIVRDSGRYAVASVRLDGSDRKVLAAGRRDDYSPQFSRDDKQIVFASTRDGHAEVYVMNADGSNQRRITNTDGGSYYPGTFSSDAKWIALQGQPSGSNVPRLYVVSSDGSGLRALTDSTKIVREVQSSPTDDRILFSARPVAPRDWMQLTPAERDSFMRQTELYTIRRDGTGLTRVTSNDARETGPAWTADGKHISYFVSRGSPPVLHRMTVAADGSSRGSRDEADAIDGVRSPDGKLVVYAKRDPGSAGVYVRDLSTGKERLVTGGN